MISAVMTIYERPRATLSRVFDSLEAQAHDELVIVLDGTPRELGDWVKAAVSGMTRARIVEIIRGPGWLCPAKAWNVGIQAATGDTLYCFSSEVIQADGNIDLAAKLLSEYHGRAVVFGKCVDDGSEGLVVSDRPNVLCDSVLPRPLGFIWAARKADVTAAGGYDEQFMAGHWYDDNDFFYRLWRQVGRFVFDDAIYGTHQHHGRAGLTEESIARNYVHILHKYGKVPVIDPPIAISVGGRTVWETAGLPPVI